jgi:hypothetical protein
MTTRLAASFLLLSPAALTASLMSYVGRWQFALASVLVLALWVGSEMVLSFPLDQTTQVNVTFHTTGAIATAAFFSSTQPRPASDAVAARPSVLVVVIGFVAGVVEHGAMDYLPHSYPIPSGMDVVFSIVLFIVAVALTKPQFRVLVTTCFIGSIIPDLVDLGPPILNRHLGWSLPSRKNLPMALATILRFSLSRSEEA